MTVAATFFSALGLIVAGALLVMLGTLAINALTLPRLGRPSRDPARLRRFEAEGEGVPSKAEDLAIPLVSMLVPAREEAARIGPTVVGLLAQQAPGVEIEVLVLDDGSTDGTADVARAAGAGDSRLRVLEGAPLPEGWAGKNWACQQLGQAARGEVLVFTDADVDWRAGALAGVLDQLRDEVGLVTVWPTQRTESWAERLVVPLMALVVLGYLPTPLVHHSPSDRFAAAVGQCLAFRRAAYRSIGGHASVRGLVLEDVALARRLKAMGHKMRLVDGAGLLACRMYDGWPAVRDGYAKNIIAGYGGLPGLALATLFHWAVFVGPWLWLAIGVIDGWSMSVDGSGSGLGSALGGEWAWPLLADAPWRALWPGAPLLLMLAGVAVRALSARLSRQRMRDALLMPISVILMTVIVGRALQWRLRAGGPQWKGRRLPG